MLSVNAGISQRHRVVLCLQIEHAFRPTAEDRAYSKLRSAETSREADLHVSSLRASINNF